MVARGRFGGGAQRSLLIVDMDVPLSLRLQINGDKALRNVGNRVATYVRRRLRSGTDGDGSPLPRPESGGEPLKATGELIRSIKYRRQDQMVMASTRTRSDVSQRARSNFGLMAIHIAGIYHRRSGTGTSRPDLADPMHTQDPGLRKKIGEWVERELARQTATGEYGMVAEMKKKRISR